MIVRMLIFNIFFKLNQLLGATKGLKKRASQQTFRPSYFARALIVQIIAVFVLHILIQGCSIGIHYSITGENRILDNLSGNLVRFPYGSFYHIRGHSTTTWTNFDPLEWTNMIHAVLLNRYFSRLFEADLMVYNYPQGPNLGSKQY